MGAEAVAGIIQGIASIGGNALNHYESVRQQHWMEDMYRQDREYNTPANQVKRLRDAGLNPALGMSNGAVNSGVTSGPPSGYERPSYDFSPAGNAVSQSLSLAMQKERNDADVRNIDANTQATTIKNRFAVLREVTEIGKLLSDSNLNNTTREYLRKRQEFLQKEIDAYDRNNAADLRVKSSQADLLDEQVITQSFERDLKSADFRLKVRLSDAQIGVLSVEAGKIAVEAEQMVLNGASQRQVNTFIADREREAARQAHITNDTLQEVIKSNIERTKAETKKLGREHRTHNVTILGIPFGTRDSIEDWSDGDPNNHFPVFDSDSHWLK